MIFSGATSNIWLNLGAVRAMVRDSPIAPLVASGMGASSLRLLMVQVWVRDDKSEMKKASQWHNDLHSWHNDVEDAGFKAKYVTLWLALTDTNSSVEFLLGSHRAKHSCTRLGKYTTMVDQA